MILLLNHILAMKKQINIFLHSLGIELRKTFMYKIEFWVSFFATTCIPVLVSYLMWKSIYAHNNVSEMNGYTLSELVLYYFCIHLSWKAIFSKGSGYIARDIYYGGLNKYIVYPVSYLNFKFGEYIGKSVFYFLNLILFIIAHYMFLGNEVTFFNFLSSFLLILLSTLTFYLVSSSIEYLSFWVDNIWSLAVMLRSMVAFGGGVLVPLSFYPESLQNFLHFTPFPYLFYYPVQIMIGKKSPYSVLTIASILSLWIILSYLLNRFVWKKGSYKYSGVGI